MPVMRPGTPCSWKGATNLPPPPRSTVRSSSLNVKPSARLEVVEVGVPCVRLVAGQIGVAAEDAELARRQRNARRRVGREPRLRRRLDGIRRGEIERPDIAIVGFGHAELEVVAQAEVEGQAIGHAPVVVREESVADDLRVVLGTKLDERACWSAGRA